MDSTGKIKEIRTLLSLGTGKGLKKKKKKTKQNFHRTGHNKSVALPRSPFLPHKEFCYYSLKLSQADFCKNKLFPLIFIVKYYLYE
jgi:hypothetical protein